MEAARMQEGEDHCVGKTERGQRKRQADGA